MNIFKIQEELIDLFNQIEENYGEVTDEIAEKLAVTEDNLKSKIESYVNVIKLINSDVALIDEEKKRLDSLKKTKNNLVERLTSIIVTAIDNFGDTNKSGVKFVDYGTGKVSIRRSTKVELDDEKLNIMAEKYKAIVHHEASLGNASTTDCVSYEEFIERVPDITSDDIEDSQFTISINVPLNKLLDSNLFDTLKRIHRDSAYVEVSPKIDKASLKEKLTEDSNITIGKLVQNKSITIK